MEQAVDKKSRYRPVKHKLLRPGDIVLLVEKNQKRYQYLMGRVQSVEVNSLGEGTSAYVFKGSTKELVYRHVTSLILLLSREESVEEEDEGGVDSEPRVDRNLNCNGSAPAVRRQPSRAASSKCRSFLKDYAAAVA